MILITGSTGLVGSRLLFDLTLAGNHVRAMKRNTSSMLVVDRIFRDNKSLLSQVEWIDGDVNDLYSLEEAFEGIQEVYHAAALVSFHSSDAKRLMKINAEGTANMVNMALTTPVEKFCFVGSTSALGKMKDGETLTENSVWKTSKYNSAYAISKYAAEREVWRGMEEGLNAVIVNPSIILGAGNTDSGSSALFGEVKKGLKFYPVGSSGFVDVRDVTRIMIQLMEKNIFGERFIISSENISYRDVFNQVADCFGKARPSIRVGKFLSELGWRLEAASNIFSNKKKMITKDTARNGQHHWLYSNNKIKKTLSTEFIPVKDSIIDTCKALSEK
jgi:dihydroflavonol-4-reductase